MEKSWEEILTIRNGKNQKKVVNPDGAYPIYGSGGVMGFANDYLCEPGTTIIGRKGSINKPIYVTERFWNVDTAFGLVPGEKLDSKYFYYFCKTYNFMKHNKATTLPSLTKADLLKIKMNVPPLPTQKKIAAILDAADAYRQKTKALIEKYDELTQSLFLDMFGDPVRNPKNMKTILGKEMFKFSSGKYNPTKNLSDENEFPTYGGNGITGYSKDYLLDYDTIVIGRVGAYCGSIHKTHEKIWVTDNAIYIKEFKSVVNLTYVFYFFKGYNLNRFADFSGQPKITQKPLENMSFINPSMDLQNQFAERVQKIEAQKAQAQESLEKAEELFNSLLGRAFKGELSI